MKTHEDPDGGSFHQKGHQGKKGETMGALSGNLL